MILRMKKFTIYRISFNLFKQFIRKSKYITVTWAIDAHAITILIIKIEITLDVLKT